MGGLFFQIQKGKYKRQKAERHKDKRQKDKRQYLTLRRGL